MSNGLGWRFVPYKDSQGNPTLKEIPNETHVVKENKIMLHGKINENKGISITGYVEIPYGTIPNATQYSVDYDERMITFHPSIEGKTVNVRYFSEGSMVLDNASIATFDDNGNPISTFAEDVALIKADYQTIKTAFEEFCNANILKFKWYDYIPTQAYTTFSLSLIPDMVYNPVTDSMIVYVGSLPLRYGVDYDYTLEGSNIIFKSGIVNSSANDIHILMLRGYQEDTTVPTGDGSLIMNGSITKMKLDTSLQALLDSIAEKALNVDMARTTTLKTVTGAINELNGNKANKTEVIPYIDYANTSVSPNTALTRGVYRCNHWTIHPTVSGDAYDESGSIFVIPFNDNFLLQTFTCTYHANKVFERSRNNGAWGDWRERAFKDEVVGMTTFSVATNMNTITEDGIYKCAEWTNYPSDSVYNKLGKLTVLKYNSNFVQQIYHTMYDCKMYIRNLDNGTWTEWQKVATTKSWNIPLVNNWVNYDSTADASCTGKSFTANLRIKNGIFSPNATICSFGSDYAPSTVKLFEVFNTAGYVGVVKMTTTGDLVVVNLSANNDCVINVNYTIK